jgi:hypothetical protein
VTAACQPTSSTQRLTRLHRGVSKLGTHKHPEASSISMTGAAAARVDQASTQIQAAEMEGPVRSWERAEPYDAFWVGREPGGAERGAPCGGSDLRVDADDAEHLLLVAGGVVAVRRRDGREERAEGVLGVAAAEGDGGRLRRGRAPARRDGEGEGGGSDEEAGAGEEQEKTVGGGWGGGGEGGCVWAARLGLVVGAAIGGQVVVVVAVLRMVERHCVSGSTDESEDAIEMVWWLDPI